MTAIIRPSWSTSTALPVTQAAHGFAVGEQLFFDGAAWMRAIANSSSTLRQATVAQVINGDQLLLAFDGVIDWPAHGLRIGVIQYLSDTVPGGLSETPPPSVLSHLRQMVAVAISADQVRLLVQAVEPEPPLSSQTGQTVQQVNHGFAIGDQVYFDGTIWRGAQANNSATLRMATVAYLLTADSFILAFEGVMEWPAHGLASGVRHYLSDTVAGGVVVTAPTTPGAFQQPVLVPLGPDHVRLLEYIEPAESSTPVGTILASASQVVPGGFLACEGAAVSRVTYAALFAAIGTNWGAGDGSTTFNLPDLRDWYLRGCGTANTPGTEFAQATARPATAFTGVSDSAGAHNHTMNTAGQHTHIAGTGGAHDHGQAAVGARNNMAGFFYQDPSGYNTSKDFDTTPGEANIKTVGLFTRHDGHTHATDAKGDHTHSLVEAGAHAHTTSITGGGDAETRPRSKHVLYLIKF